MAETNLGFSKIVSTPTPLGWSQAYNAGHLFAVFSLQNHTMPEGENLTNTGKDLISTFESEFFTLETKDLESIKNALITTSSKIPENITLSFVVCYLTENVLYLFATGGGKAILKRSEKIGTVLEANDEKEIKSASGYVKEDDLIVLQTKNFQKIIPQSNLASALDSANPTQIAEELAPMVHEKADGGASALILSYKEGAVEPPVILSSSDQEENINETIEEISKTDNLDESTETNPPTPVVESIETEKDTDELEIPEITPDLSSRVIDDLPNISNEELPPITPIKRKRSMNFGFIKNPLKILPKGKKIIALVGVLIIVLIIITASFAIFKRNSSSDQKLFESVFSEAQAKYDEGINLKDLNGPLAQKGFQDAETLINKNIDEFNEGSDEYTKLNDLLTKIESELTSSAPTVSAKEVDKSESQLLSYELDNPKANYFAQSTSNVFFLDGTGVSRIDKGNDKKEQVVKKVFNSGGIGAFGSNFYVLDKDDGILKFAPSEDEYAETDYFTEAPDLKNAVSMGIDGSVYILFKDGSIKKYTRGAEVDFEISEIDKELSSPTRITTNDDSDNIYILDNGNSRIAVLDKTGKFVATYSSEVIKSAKDIDVNETDKKIFVLSGGKIYQLDIK